MSETSSLTSLKFLECGYNFRVKGGSLGTWQEQSLKVYNLFSLKVLVVMDSLWLWQHKSLKVIYGIAWEVLVGLIDLTAKRLGC
ncbi:hypothetical protein Tco_1014179 [Tanacetum coccineum]